MANESTHSRLAADVSETQVLERAQQRFELGLRNYDAGRNSLAFRIFLEVTRSLEPVHPTYIPLKIQAHYFLAWTAQRWAEKNPKLRRAALLFEEAAVLQEKGLILIEDTDESREAQRAHIVNLYNFAMNLLRAGDFERAITQAMTASFWNNRLAEAQDSKVEFLLWSVVSIAWLGAGNLDVARQTTEYAFSLFDRSDAAHRRTYAILCDQKSRLSHAGA